MTDRAKYKTALETELAEITKQLETLGIHNPQVSEDWIALPVDAVTSEADSNIVADRSEDWQEARGTLVVLETRFNNINRALTKITDGTYGICEIGGEEIETDRLDANAAARTCKDHIEDEANLPR